MAPSTKTTTTPASNPVVRILEVCRVKPSSASHSPTEFTLPLTFFDTCWFKFPPTQRVYFFQLTDSNSAAILPSLKRSLSLALSHFLPLAGTLTWPARVTKPFVLYTQDDAVSLTVAESTSDNFNHLLTTKFREAAESHPYVPELTVSDSAASVLSLQITFFPDRGFSIGTSIHHAILDGKSIAMFVKTWAHINKTSSSSVPPDLTPSFDRTAIKDLEGLDVEILNHWSQQEWEGGGHPTDRSLMPLPGGPVPPSSVRAEYVFSRADITRIREKVWLELQDKEKPMHLSSFVLAFSYTLVCMVKAKGLDRNKEVSFGFMADCRARLDPPLPETYFGNCVVPFKDVAKVGDMVKLNGFACMAERVSELVKGIEKKGVLDGAKEKLIKFKASESSEKQLIGVAGSPKFKVYEVDFGWGRPKKVEVTSIDMTGAISMAESRDESGGIEVGLVLKKHEMELFDSLFVNGLN